MSRIRPLPLAGWTDTVTPAVASAAQSALEAGGVLLLPSLRFVVDAAERAIFSPDILSSSKNASFDPFTGSVSGTTLDHRARQGLADVMARFSQSAERLLQTLLPSYRDQLVRARASFRPAEVAGRHTSWRKDDTRLHVDAFPASPVQGRRILRVFSNVNPEGRPRTWRIGPDFADVARRFAASLSAPWPGAAHLLRLLRVTKSLRTPYDALMLQLHDAMKADADFQRSAPQEQVEFASGSTWIAFTDQVSHAALAGQYQFEQTFLLPIDAMQDPSRSPLRILEGITARRLA